MVWWRPTRGGACTPTRQWPQLLRGGVAVRVEQRCSDARRVDIDCGDRPTCCIELTKRTQFETAYPYKGPHPVDPTLMLQRASSRLASATPAACGRLFLRAQYVLCACTQQHGEMIPAVDLGTAAYLRQTVAALAVTDVLCVWLIAAVAGAAP